MKAGDWGETGWETINTAHTKMQQAVTEAKSSQNNKTNQLKKA